MRLKKEESTKKQKNSEGSCSEKTRLIWNNQYYFLKDATVTFPLMIDGKVKETSCALVLGNIMNI